MTKHPARALALLMALTVLCVPAFAGKRTEEQKKPKEKENNEAAVKAAEEEIRDLREQEESAVKRLDERYEHILRYLDPKEVHGQLEAILGVLHQVNELLGLHDNGTVDPLSYGGFRRAARGSVDRAEHQVGRALEHDTAEERRKAAEDMGAAFEDMAKALAFSREHPGAGKEELEWRAVENLRLAEALPRIELAHWLLAAADHEIADFKAERELLRGKLEAEKRAVKEQFEAKRRELEEKLKALRK